MEYVFPPSITVLIVYGLKDATQTCSQISQQPLTEMVSMAVLL